ncbi:hypothetical protein A9K97_gp379 [Tokyovirus A1]|uniref:hypothetical protein n=1 Tax=Tokyovirus A1 TaxID=1826170 RepID=UPI0007A96E4C|nr:hypothetical protein A9K97_gp379 [Tokyovirus A1]BAU79972.1 hypothetical protein [Tokyovirus A1]
MSSINSLPDLIGMMKSSIDNDVAELQKKLAQVRLEKLQIQQLLFMMPLTTQENIFG